MMLVHENLEFWIFQIASKRLNENGLEGTTIGSTEE